MRRAVRLVAIAAYCEGRVLPGRVEVEDSHIFRGETLLSQRLGRTVGLRFLLESPGDDRCHVISCGRVTAKSRRRIARPIRAPRRSDCTGTTIYKCL
jgi:hypothetical protein